MERRWTKSNKRDWSLEDQWFKEIGIRKCWTKKEKTTRTKRTNKKEKSRRKTEIIGCVCSKCNFDSYL